MQVILLEKSSTWVTWAKSWRARRLCPQLPDPQKKARRATDAALKEFEARRAELEKLQAEKLAAAQALGERLNGYQLKIVQKAGVDGRLFGSVTNGDIAEGLKKADFAVEKAQVRLPNGHLKAIGEYPIQVVSARRRRVRRDRSGRGRPVLIPGRAAEKPGPRAGFFFCICIKACSLSGFGRRPRAFRRSRPPFHLEDPLTQPPVHHNAPPGLRAWLDSVDASREPSVK